MLRAKSNKEEGRQINSLWTTSRGIPYAAVRLAMVSIAVQAATFLMPFQMQLILDRVVQVQDRSLLGIIAISFLALALINACFEFARQWTLSGIGSVAAVQIYSNIVHHVFSRHPIFFDKVEVGDMLSRISSANTAQELVLKGVVSCVIDSIVALCATIVLAIYQPMLAAIALIGIALQAALSLLTFPFLRAATDKRLQSAAAEQSFIVESVRGATDLHLFGKSHQRAGRLVTLNQTTVRRGLEAVRLQSLIASTQAILGSIQMITILYIGANIIVSSGALTIGMLVTFLALRQMLAERTNSVIAQTVQLLFVRLHLDRLKPLLEAPGDDVDSPWTDVSGNFIVKLDMVTFNHGRNTEQTLRDISLTVRVGEFISVQGRSGSGKSTLAKLLLGIYTPSSGSLILGGATAAPTWAAWRRRIGIVSQDDTLFGGTIAENVSFFEPSAPLSEIEAVARMVGLDGEIGQMPEGYATKVGDMGRSLSGGQRQRILLARALFRKPEILILDEVTSHLDPELEEEIGQLLASLRMTRIVLGHRRALAQLADRSFEIVDGRLRPATCFVEAQTSPR